jgi:NADPH:quinone reductase
MRAVRLDDYGDRDVLYVADVDTPEPGPDEVLVRIVAVGINPGEAAIRQGFLKDRFPATFPSGQGSDFAGVVSAVGSQVHDVAVDDEVIGWSEQRSSQADFIAVGVDQLTPKPAGLGWLEAGSLYMPAATATPAVEAVRPQAGDVIAVSGAAGGVGSTAVQLLALAGVKVLAIASTANHDWLAKVGTTPVAYGEDLESDLRAAAPGGIDAFVDLYGPEYLDLAVRLGVAPERIETIISFEKAGELDFPIAATFALEDVKDAYALLEQRHSHGRVVLVVDPERAGVSV